ncbi:Swi5 protein [Coemansia asiatica]|nr:Swi5 protein [Coemansia asiatica]
MNHTCHFGDSISAEISFMDKVESDKQDDERRKELEAAIDALKQELARHIRGRDDLLERSGLSVEQARQETDKHIDRLHRYNDIKDVGQVLFGKLAELHGKTVKEMYEKYGVDTSD